MEWYYVGHYGQLGPLTREQVDELIASNVIERDTYVWRSGWSEWVRAGDTVELGSSFQLYALPPEPPPFAPPPPSPTGYARPSASTGGYGGSSSAPANPGGFFPAIPSTKSRVAAGILQILLPGVGRMYLGYSAIGVLQLMLAICSFGVLSIWSIIDGIIILTGGLRMDGYGRTLND
ncbi:MAG: GYF domain-containing protein [Fimbriimonadaceae bacterium]